MAINAKRKRDVVVHQGSSSNGDLDTSKPSAVFRPTKGRPHTLSIALPGSIISNVKTYDMKLALAGRIARACAIFCVDEIVIFNDGQFQPDPSRTKDLSKDKSYKGSATDYWNEKQKTEIAETDEPWQNPDQFLFHILSYLETPPNLRKLLFPHHPNLKGAGALPSLDMPHHMRPDEWCQYREGVTVNGKGSETASSPVRKKSKKGSQTKEHLTTSESALVDCGLSHPVPLQVPIPPDTRVTLKFATKDAPSRFPTLSAKDVGALTVEPVDSAAPREEAGFCWGYTSRCCNSLSTVFTECPFDDGYDVCIGTSERGLPFTSVLPDQSSTASKRFSQKSSTNSAKSDERLPGTFTHLLLVFGGVAGLEAAVAADSELAARGIDKENASKVFDAWVNLVPQQGSRTIRTEEAVLIGLQALKGYVDSMQE